MQLYWIRCVHTAPCPSALAGCFWNPVDSTLVACTFDHTVLIHKPKDLSVAKRFVGSFDEVTSLKYDTCAVRVCGLYVYSTTTKIPNL